MVVKHLKIKQKWNSALLKENQDDLGFPSLELLNSFDLKMSWDAVSWV